MNRFQQRVCRSAHWKNVLEQKVIPWALDGVDLGPEVLEIGPGPGLTTDILRGQCSHLTSIEIDRQMAAALDARMANTHVTVVEGDATRMPFANHAFSGAISLTMLHHVPSLTLQDQLFAEVFRVLKPGGMFVGTDNTSNWAFRLIHFRDICVPVPPQMLGARLECVGFTDVAIEVGRAMFRFRARRP